MQVLTPIPSEETRSVPGALGLPLTSTEIDPGSQLYILPRFNILAS